MLRRIVFCVIVSFLVGCGSPNTSPSESSSSAANKNALPANWKEMARTYVKEKYKDPRSVIDSEIGKPFFVNNLHPSWKVCLRNNSKNGYGAYTGLQYTEIVIKDGEIKDYATGTGDDAFFCNNGYFDKSTLEPFPIYQ